MDRPKSTDPGKKCTGTSCREAGGTGGLSSSEGALRLAGTPLKKLSWVARFTESEGDRGNRTKRKNTINIIPGIGIRINNTAVRVQAAES